MTELGTIMMFECEQPARRRPHHRGPLHRGGHRPRDRASEVAYGERGERVVTSFGRGMIPRLPLPHARPRREGPAHALHLRAHVRHLRGRHPRPRGRHAARARHQRLPARRRGDRARARGGGRVPDPPRGPPRASATRSRVRCEVRAGHEAGGRRPRSDLAADLVRNHEGLSIPRRAGAARHACRASS